MVLRSMPASRKRKLNVPNTSNSGSPAEKPSDNIRKLAGCKYTRKAASQEGDDTDVVTGKGSGSGEDD